MTEMLVVVSVISILSIASFYTLNVSGEKARDLKRYKDMETIEAALYAYYGDNGEFPKSIMVGVNPQWQTICTNNSYPGNQVPVLIPQLIPTYLSSIPQDPKGCFDTPSNYNGYIYISNGTDFKIAGDWTFEIGDLCDTQGDKYFDRRRGPGMPGYPATPNGYMFCSLSSSGTISDTW
jgi:type II secretory pathway pseudopilin PulG